MSKEIGFYSIKITKSEDGGHYIDTVDCGIPLIEVAKVLEIKLNNIWDEIKSKKYEERNGKSN